MATTISFRTEEEKRDELDAIAGSLDRDRTWVLNEAIDNYLDLHRWQNERVIKSTQALKEGRAYSTTELRGRFAKRNSEARAKKPVK